MREVQLSPDAGPIAVEVYRRMRERGLSQKRLATKAGVNPTYIRDIFKGKSKNPKQEQLSKVAAALGCSLDELISFSPGETSAEPQEGNAADEFEHPVLGKLQPVEIALVQLWRDLSPFGQQLLMLSAGKSAPKPTRRRKANDI